MDKPHSEACERNKVPILQCLRPLYAPLHTVFEIGSGTGQHALHFAAAMPHLSWQCSETLAQMDTLQRGLAGHALRNLALPRVFAVGQPWPETACDAVFTANTLHIMGWDEVQQLFAGLAGWLPLQGLFTVYGPFNVGGRFTSDGNARFDASLRAADPRRGLRDFEAVDALARAAGLQLLEDRAMPANNRCLSWRRSGDDSLR